MYVPILALGFAVLLLLVESALLWMFAKSWSRNLRVIVQAGLVIAVWPTLQIAGEVIFFLNTEDGYAHTVAETPPKLVLPENCTGIKFHHDPTGEWFRCQIDNEYAEKWLASQSFVSSDALHCGPFEDLEGQNIKLQNKRSRKYYETHSEANGGGRGALLNGRTLLVCQWYW